MDGLYACILCCAKGEQTPVFKGPDPLALHLRSHAGEEESLDMELRDRFKIIVGRCAEQNEVFDVLIPAIGKPQTSQS